MHPYGHKKCPAHGRIDEFFVNGHWVCYSGCAVPHRSRKKTARAEAKKEISTQLRIDACKT